MGRLDGKIAIITGLAGGIGRAAALLFAAEGAQVVGCDLKIDETLETERLARAAGGQMTAMTGVDLGEEASANPWISPRSHSFSPPTMRST